VPRYRFEGFVLSPRRRLLVRDGQELPLIPRYFDLLVFLVERRHEAVHRREIFDRVWSDVIVSDSALSQAIRTLRRTLGEDPREPRFIRTVSRHGYRFVYPEVIEEADDEVWRPQATVAPADPPPANDVVNDAFEPLLDRVTQPARTSGEEEERREAAELLHALGTEEALHRLDRRPGHARGRALLRDTRWDSPNARPVPLLGAPAPLAVARELVALRLRRAARMVAIRWAGASIGGGIGGAAAGAIGALLLMVAPGSDAPLAVLPVLALIGGVSGAVGGAGVGAGLSVAETIVRSRRASALAAGAALGGAAVGLMVQWLARWSLTALVGIQVDIRGGIEGLVIGAAAGLGYAAATRRVQGGLPALRGRQRFRAAVVTAALCGVGAFALAWSERPLVGGTVHAIARQARGAQITLTPLGRLIGEPDFGQWSQIIIGTGEGAIFGFGLTIGLMRRPSSRTSHETVTSA
jgi:DNA-binding winged helix-turn-helix (wHTH) protein